MVYSDEPICHETQEMAPFHELCKGNTLQSATRFQSKSKFRLKTFRLKFRSKFGQQTRTEIVLFKDKFTEYGRAYIAEPTWLLLRGLLG